MAKRVVKPLLLIALLASCTPRSCPPSKPIVIYEPTVRMYRANGAEWDCTARQFKGNWYADCVPEPR
jgi:hypothetical protein